MPLNPTNQQTNQLIFHPGWLCVYVCACVCVFEIKLFLHLAVCKQNVFYFG